MCPPSWTPSPLHSPLHPSGLSQNTGFECPASCIEPTLVICFTYGNTRFNAFLSNHPALPFPYSPKVCSLHLYLLLSCQFSSVAQSCPTLCDPHGLQHTRPPCPSPTPGGYPSSCPSSQWCHPTILILCRPLLLLPSFFPSIRVSSNELALRMRWLKYWSFSFNISPSSEHPGLISFRINWLDLLALQGTRKSLLQHHSSKASILGTQLSL